MTPSPGSPPSVPHPSLGRHLTSVELLPRLLHTLHQQNNSVLCLSADDHHIFSGSQSEDISVWDKASFCLQSALRGHTGSVLALEYAKDKKWLFSSSGDSTVRIWSTVTLAPVYVLRPYLETGAGDLFSLAWSPALQTIYIGCQNTSLQWFDFRLLPTLHLCPESGTSTPSETSRRPHKFFDSYPQYARRPADIYANNGMTIPPIFNSEGVPVAKASLQIPATNVIDSAHYGYVYCLRLLSSAQEGSDDLRLRASGSEQLVSGSGDETVKLWDCTSSRPSLLHTFYCSQGAVLSLVVRSQTLYTGCQDGHVQVWDLETKTLVRTVIVQENVDILSLSMMDSDLYTCSANGQVQCWSASDCTASWPAHQDGIVLSSMVTKANNSDQFLLITGGNDDYIKLWAITPPRARSITLQLEDTDIDEKGSSKITTDIMSYALSKFVSIPSISSCPKNHEDCRQAAIWLKKCLIQLGAQSTLVCAFGLQSLPTCDGKNPLVLATFQGTQGKQPKPRLLFYGHYDVMPAPPENWISDPFTVTGRNGYLYGRGVTDNKGPILAVACAATELLGQRALGLDLVFLIEGEEEVGSCGFDEAVRNHKDLIGPIDSILVSNSTWIAEESPCITYGLRGVVHCDVEISSHSPDLHSGIEGGGIAEPMLDMIKLLSTLTTGAHGVQIQGFYDQVRAQTENERELYQRLSTITRLPASSLSSRWREPSLTVHNITTSGPNNATVIPGTVQAQVSLRIVPDQDLDTIAMSLCNHLQSTFASFQSPNKLEVSIKHRADWWLGNLDDPWFKALESAVQDEWGVEPLRIREGGSIPSVPFLEKEFGCHAHHLPMGQSSDQAHLPNERISLSNLRRGKSVIERFLRKVADKDISTDTLALR